MAKRDAVIIDQVPKPIGKNIVLKLKVHTETEGGILLPTERVSRGIVVGDYKFDDIELSDGDVVYLNKGDSVGDKFQVGNELYLVIPPNYISAVIG